MVRKDKEKKDWDFGSITQNLLIIFITASVQSTIMGLH